jgi:flagellar biosynthetic protein FlhB
MAGEDRSQRATPRRREKARERGQVVRSRELPSALTLLAVAILLRWGRSGGISAWRNSFRRVLNAAVSGDLTVMTPLMHWTAWELVRWTAPALALAWCISALGVMAQGGFVLSPLALSPNLSRLNPVNNLSRIFSVAGLSPLLKSLIPVSIIAYLAVALALREWLHLIYSPHMALPAAFAWLAAVLYEFAWKAGLVLLAWSGFDYALQRLSYERSLRMSHQEVREEHKDLEGNPATRGRVRRKQREMRRRMMMRQVARATVVVTNPDEYAVALEYVPEKMAAPLVLAKGRGLLAQKIKSEARWYEVPIVENRLLARALHRTVQVGGTIPPTLYTAVAEVLAFIYRAQARMRDEKVAQGTRTQTSESSET